MTNFKHKKLNPWHYLLLSFTFLIIVGALVLSLPEMRAINPLSFIDALFTATSAVCVTGLIVVKTTDFSLLGQIVLLILMQLGAIGIMTITTSLIQLIRGNLDLEQRLSFSQLQDSINLKSSNGVLQFILRITFVTEIIGASLISLGFYLQGFSPKQAIYHGVFQSVSAFCNAGFSSFDDSLIGTHWLVKYTIMALIIIGGLGYFVIYEVYHNRKFKSRFSLHTKIVVYTSLFLVLVGGFFIFLVENNTSITDSLFQSVTARTAGFNSVNVGSMHLVSLLVITLLMFIGASPGSTGGGIKTTTFFIVNYSIFKVLRGETSINIFNRHITHKIILRALALVVVYFMAIILAATLLLLKYPFDFFDTFFEVISALGTVGLSLGITAQLDMYGKIIIILCMFLGRIGPATLAMMTLRKQKEIKIKYPEDRVVLG
ncbi:MAG: potassium transporter TrkG [Flavobacteriaceae bacterium]